MIFFATKKKLVVTDTLFAISKSKANLVTTERKFFVTEFVQFKSHDVMKKKNIVVTQFVLLQFHVVAT